VIGFDSFVFITDYKALLFGRYDSEGKETSMASVGSGLSPSTKSGARSMYSDRVSLSHITSNPSLGEDKVYKSLALCKILWYVVRSAPEYICWRSI
jgi:hypothetical protein